MRVERRSQLCNSRIVLLLTLLQLCLQSRQARSRVGICLLELLGHLVPLGSSTLALFSRRVALLDARGQFLLFFANGNIQLFQLCEGLLVARARRLCLPRHLLQIFLQALSQRRALDLELLLLLEIFSQLRQGGLLCLCLCFRVIQLDDQIGRASLCLHDAAGHLCQLLFQVRSSLQRRALALHFAFQLHHFGNLGILSQGQPLTLFLALLELSEHSLKVLCQLLNVVARVRQLTHQILGLALLLINQQHKLFLLLLLARNLQLQQVATLLQLVLETGNLEFESILLLRRRRFQRRLVLGHGRHAQRHVVNLLGQRVDFGLRLLQHGRHLGNLGVLVFQHSAQLKQLLIVVRLGLVVGRLHLLEHRVLAKNLIRQRLCAQVTLASLSLHSLCRSGRSLGFVGIHSHVAQRLLKQPARLHSVVEAFPVVSLVVLNLGNLLFVLLLLLSRRRLQLGHLSLELVSNCNQVVALIRHGLELRLQVLDAQRARILLGTA